MSEPATLLMIFQIGTAAFGSIRKGSYFLESWNVNCWEPLKPFILSSISSAFSISSYYSLSFIIKGAYYKCISCSSSFLLERISDIDIILCLRCAWSRPDSFTDFTVSNLLLKLLAYFEVGVTSSYYFISKFIYSEIFERWMLIVIGGPYAMSSYVSTFIDGVLNLPL